MPGSECCEHCAEIPLLREEVAALRARLNALTTLPLSLDPPVKCRVRRLLALAFTSCFRACLSCR